MSQESPIKHIVLTSHPSSHSKSKYPIHWGQNSAKTRGPIIASVLDKQNRNVIGTHSGSYMIYRALAVAAGKLKASHKPDLTNTLPTVNIGPFDSWFDPKKIVSMDPFGALTSEVFAEEIAAGVDIRPSIAITQANIELSELKELILSGELIADGKILTKEGSCFVTKAAIEPVWYLPGVAERFNISESSLRQSLFEHTAGMYPELITRPDLSVFLPPIGGHSLYIFGDPSKINQQDVIITCRVHDECNGSDVFGSDICTCRPYLIHGIEMCIKQAQEGGLGMIIYNRKEGRALGEVTKFLVYNARKRQEGGDQAAKYFERTECVAGVQDMRFQELMPDILHWLGIKKIHRFISMSDMKHDALVRSGIQIKERVSIPMSRIPKDAHVEMDAKVAAGYYSPHQAPDSQELQKPKGRSLVS